MLYQSILPLIIVLVYFLFWILKRQVDIAYRFFNDTYPNHQMAIDSYLYSQKITDIEADQKRKLLYSIKTTCGSIHFIYENFFLIWSYTLFFLFLINIGLTIIKPETQNAYILIIIILNICVGILLIILCNKIFKRLEYLNNF